jgi:hypothetical protein
VNETDGGKAPSREHDTQRTIERRLRKDLHEAEVRIEGLEKDLIVARHETEVVKAARDQAVRLVVRYGGWVPRTET